MQTLTTNNEPSVSLPSIHALSPRDEALSWASVDFAQLIESAGAQSVVEAIRKRFRVSETRMKDVIECSGPFLIRAHRHWLGRPGGREILNSLARSGGPQQFADKPALVSASIIEQEGRNFLKILFLEDTVVELATQRIAARFEMHSVKLGQMMPYLAALFVGCICKSIAA